MTSITNDGDKHLIPLSIKVAEAEVEEDVAAEDIKTLLATTDITSATDTILDSLHNNIVNMIDPLNKHTKRSTMLYGCLLLST